MTFTEQYDKAIKEFPGLRIVKKADSLFMKIIGALLLVVTFGTQRAFMRTFTTTIGNTIYVPKIWNKMLDTHKISILRHECVHLRQQKKYGRLLFSFLYLFVPLPMGLAYFRAKFEKEAYEESLRSAYENLGPAVIHNSVYKHAIVRQFTSGAYGWMWPFKKSMEKWYDETVEKICNEPKGD